MGKGGIWHGSCGISIGSRRPRPVSGGFDGDLMGFDQ